MVATKSVITRENEDKNREKAIMAGFESSLSDIFEVRANDVETIALQQLSSDRDKIFGDFVRKTIKLCESNFNSEEASGKYLDLNAQYLTFKSLKGVHAALEKEIVGPATGTKVPQDYLSWLKCLHRIP